jgi:hypothetical protein
MAVRLSVLRAGRPLPLGSFLVLISVRGLVDPKDIGLLMLEGLVQLKSKMTSSGNEPTTFRLVEKCLHATACPRQQIHF